MNELQKFNNPKFGNVRTIEESGIELEILANPQKAPRQS